MNHGLFDISRRLRVIADLGLLYSQSSYDRERYAEIKELSIGLLSSLSDHSEETLRSHFPLLRDYPTAKVDIRGIALSPEKKILLVRESSDGKWSLPGGWADEGFSPKEVIVKEFKEETGLDVEPLSLLPVFDKMKHAHPPQLFSVYKMIFHVEMITASIKCGFDVADVDFFSIDHLPELSEDRILKTQIEFLYEKISNADFQTYVD